MRIFKYIGLAAIALPFSITAALAQPASSGGSSVTPQLLHQLIRPGVSNAYGKLGGGGGITPEFSGSGTYLRHCYEADWYDDGANYYVYAFNLEGDFEYSAVPHAGSGNTITQSTLNLVCSTGQAYSIVLNGSTFYFISEKAY